ncbi:MAG: VWA domain-containing protein [Pseudomonadota bacterium]
MSSRERTDQSTAATGTSSPRPHMDVSAGKPLSDPQTQSRSVPETAGDVNAFLAQVAATPKRTAACQRGRLIFALDATASRQPTWDRACHLQAEMFEAAHGLGGLDVQLLFYRGYRECKAGKWTSDSQKLLRQMTAVQCLAGHTQIARMLRHVAKETEKQRVNAVVFVGDACEEDIDDIGHEAGKLGLLGVPCFMFQEGHDPAVANVFRQVAKLSGGAYCPFDAASARMLKDLLAAVAVFAAGGRAALESHSKSAGRSILQLTSQLRGG